MITGADLRAARLDAGLGLARIAEVTGRDKGHLSRVENGERPVTPAVIRDYERALGAPIRSGETGSDLPDSTATVDDMRRRAMLGAIAAASIGAASGGAMPRLIAALEGLDGPVPNSIGISEIEAVEAAADLYMRMDLAHGGQMAAAMASSSLRWATALLDAQMSSDNRERLCSAVGLLADRLGWSLFDTGRHQNALNVLSFALDASARGADRDLRAHVMLDLSTVVTDSGQPSSGVEVIRLALGDERISSAERANLHAVGARHCGTAGDRQAGLRHIGLAEEALTKRDKGTPPPWANRITAGTGHLDSALGLALFELGEGAKARYHLTTALNRLDQGRTRTGLRCRTRLVMLDAEGGAPSEAEQGARQALADAHDVQSRRVDADLWSMVNRLRETGLVHVAKDLEAGLHAR